MRALFVSGVSAADDLQLDERDALKAFTGWEIDLYNPGARFNKTPIATVDRPFTLAFEMGEVLETIIKTRALIDIVSEIDKLMEEGQYEVLIAHSLGCILTMGWLTGLKQVKTYITIASPLWYPAWWRVGINTELVQKHVKKWVNYWSLIDPVSAGSLFVQPGTVNRMTLNGHQVDDYIRSWTKRGWRLDG